MFPRKSSTVFWLGLLLVIVFFITLGIPPLFQPDEGRYAEIPREMWALHEFIIPHLDGLIYFEKPPLTYWLVALFQKLFGYSTWSIRAPNALMAIVSCLAVYVVCRKQYDRRTGLLSALILSSSLLFFAMAHLLTTDMLVGFCLSMSLCIFWQGLLRPLGYTILWAYVFSALAVLAKGLIGIAFPIMIVGVFILITWQWHLVKRLKPWSGFLLFLILALPWHILAQLHNSHFFYQYFYLQQFERFITPIMHRTMSHYYYILICLASFLPWTLFLPVVLKQSFGQEGRKTLLKQPELFLWLWAGLIILFFGFSDSILVPYVLPALPPLAILSGRYLALIWERKSRRYHIFIYSLMLVIWAIGNSAWIIAPSLRQKTTLVLAQTIAKIQVTYPQAKIVSYNPYFQDLPYYTKQTVFIVNGWQNDLQDSIAIEPDSQALNLLLNQAKFCVLMHTTMPLLIVSFAHDLSKIQACGAPVYILQQDHHLLLTSNRNIQV